MNEVILKINGMHCEGCAQAVQRALSGSEGVRDAKASFKEGSVHILYDSSLTGKEQMAATIDRIGYRVVGEEAASEPHS